MQVSRSIGDVYLKHPQFNREPLNPKFRLPQPMHMPILSANPSILSHPLQPNDSFLIFASDGLWEHLSNEKAVDIVNSNPHAVRFFLPCLDFLVLISVMDVSCSIISSYGHEMYGCVLRGGGKVF